MAGSGKGAAELGSETGFVPEMGVACARDGCGGAAVAAAAVAFRTALEKMAVHAATAVSEWYLGSWRGRHLCGPFRALTSSLQSTCRAHYTCVKTGVSSCCSA